MSTGAHATPFVRQYNLFLGRGEWGPTLPQTTPTPTNAQITDTFTNMSYQRSPYLGISLMFSPGGFMTRVTQTGPSEKSLWAVPLHAYRVVRHRAGDSYDDICQLLAAKPWDISGMQFRMKWGSTYTFEYEDPQVLGYLAHVRAELHVAPGEDPAPPDSPPPCWPHKGDPVNFYGVSTRLAAMSELLSCRNVV